MQNTVQELLKGFHSHNVNSSSGCQKDDQMLLYILHLVIWCSERSTTKASETASEPVLATGYGKPSRIH